MARPPITKQELIDASTDAHDLELVANGPADLNGDGRVNTRFGGAIRTLRRLLADIVAAPPEGWINAFANSPLKGAPGKDAVPPQGYRETAIQGQTIFPNPALHDDFSTVDRIGGGIGFTYNRETLCIYLGGIKLELDDDYDAPGGVEPIVFKRGLREGQVPSFYSYPLGGDPESKASGTVAKLVDFRLDTDTTDWPAVQRAYMRGFRIILAEEGKGLGTGADAGKYLVGDKPFIGLKPGAPAGSTRAQDYITSKGNLCLPDGTPMHGLQLIGDGIGRTIWKQTDNFAWNFNAKSEDRSANLMFLSFSDFTIEGLGGDTAAQTGHICAFSGVTGFRSQRVRYASFRGDAICAWPSSNPDEFTHNYDWLIRDNIFDGVNSQNRNAISIEDLVGCLIEANQFINCCTNSDLVSVAAIDVEPRDNAKYQIGSIRIAFNRFYNVSRGAVAFYVNSPGNGNYTLAPMDFQIEGNRIEKCVRSVDVSGGAGAGVSDALIRHDIRIIGNSIYNCGDMRLTGIYGGIVRGNTMELCGTLYLGVDGIGKWNRNVLIQRNVLTRCGKQNGVVLMGDDRSDDCSFEWNDIEDSGMQDRTDGPGWLFLARYGRQGLRLNNNRVNNSKGRLKAFAQMSSDASIGPLASKLNNTIYGVTIDAADNYNPPAAQTGQRFVFEFTSATPVSANTAFRYDIAALGATNGQIWLVYWEQYLEDVVGKQNNTPPLIFPQAFTLLPFAIRIQAIVAPGNGGTIAKGSRLIVQEKV